jgi:hypothetical protein
MIGSARLKRMRAAIERSEAAHQRQLAFQRRLVAEQRAADDEERRAHGEDRRRRALAARERRQQRPRAQRIAQATVAAAGLACLLPAALPFQHRYGRYVYQTEACPAPIVRVTEAKYVADGSIGECWDQSTGRVWASAVLLSVDIVGGALIVRALRPVS